MKSLILDSATKVMYCCLVVDGNVVFEEYVEGRYDHAKNIVLKVDEACKKAGITTNELDEVICGVGPGSYTGVRMAVTVCKMLSVFQNIKLYSISTLKLMASGSKGKVLASIDARRGNAFGTIIDTVNNEVIVEEALHSIEELKNNNFDYQVNEEKFIVDPIYCLENKEEVLEPHLLTPNYLRDTEAERNLNA